MTNPCNAAITRAEFNRMLNLLDLLAEDFGSSNTKVQALFWLVRAAANEHVCALLKRDGYVICPGQFVTNIKELSLAWNWQRTSIIEFLQCLQHLQIIQVDHVSKNLLITLRLRVNIATDVDASFSKAILQGRSLQNDCVCSSTKDVLVRNDCEQQNVVQNTSCTYAQEVSNDCMRGPRPSSLGRPNRREG